MLSVLKAGAITGFNWPAQLGFVTCSIHTADYSAAATRRSRGRRGKGQADNNTTALSAGAAGEVYSEIHFAFIHGSGVFWVFHCQLFEAPQQV